MNDYIGKICPYCRTAFALGDDVIVCSECDMPHHKDCWVENQGCTTFGCLGTIEVANNTAYPTTSSQINYSGANSGFIFCTKCGLQNSNTATFCTRCGNMLQTAQLYAQQSQAYVQAAPVNNAYQQPYNNQAAAYQQPYNNQATTYQTYQQPYNNQAAAYNANPAYQQPNNKADIYSKYQTYQEPNEQANAYNIAQTPQKDDFTK